MKDFKSTVGYLEYFYQVEVAQKMTQRTTKQDIRKDAVYARQSLDKKIPCQSRHRLRKGWRFQMKTQKFIRTKAIQGRTQNAQTCRD